MSLARWLVRLYPGPLRDRCGPELEAEAQAAGWTSCPGLLAGILDMWLHPVVWPARSSAERRGRAVAVSTAFALTGWLLGYVSSERAGAPADAARSWTSLVCDFLLLLGLLLMAPCPRPRPGALMSLLRRAASRLAVPVLLATAVLAGAHLVRAYLGGAAPSPTARHVVLLSWWAVLALVAFQVCRVVARLDSQVAAPPRLGRLRLGIGLIAAAFTANGVRVAGFALAAGDLGPLAAALVLGLVLLTLGCAGILRDLCVVPAAD